MGVTKERIADFVHGSDGFGNTNQEFVDDGRALPISAAQFIVESAAKWPGEVVVLALGPLTNVALALHLKPDLPALLVRVQDGHRAGRDGGWAVRMDLEFFNDKRCLHRALDCLDNDDPFTLSIPLRGRIGSSSWGAPFSTMATSTLPPKPTFSGTQRRPMWCLASECVRMVVVLVGDWLMVC